MADSVIVFYRTWHWQDAVRHYAVEIDGVRVGVRPPRGMLRCEVAAGRNDCHVAISWTGSPHIEVNVPSEGQIRIHVRPGRGPALRRVYTRNMWLRLEVDA